MTNPEHEPVRAASGAIESDVRQFVTFIVGDEVFAVDMRPVQEIIRVPEVVQVPLAPPTLDGLANLRGKVLPIFSLRRIFGAADRPNDDTTRALVIDLGQPLGFVVDRVVSVIGVESARIDSVESIEGTIDTELLSGIIKDVGGHAIIMVLDFERLIAREFADVVAVAKRASVAASASGAVPRDMAVESDELQLVSFNVAGQEYAIAIEDVQEIVQMPDRVVQIPHSAPHVLGMLTLRNRLLPLVSLRCMFGLPAQAADQPGRIVVVRAGGESVGIVMDRANAVLRVARDDVDTMPALLAGDSDRREISQICRLESGARLVSIISVPALFRHSTIADALHGVDGTGGGSRDGARDSARDGDAVDEALDDDEQVVVFRLAKEEFAAPIESVQEIVRVPDALTQVPNAPSCVEGVINLRGTVLPVIDLRRRLGLASAARSDRQRVMVFTVAGVRTGYIVDSVAEVLKIHKSDIEAAPQLSGEQGSLLTRVANIRRAQRMVQLIAPDHLVESKDRAALAAIAA